MSPFRKPYMSPDRGFEHDARGIAVEDSGAPAVLLCNAIAWLLVASAELRPLLIGEQSV